MHVPEFIAKTGERNRTGFDDLENQPLRTSGVSAFGISPKR
jgi:hypothetical protein